MSSGSASRLVNGENERNVREYEPENGKEIESGAAGGTGSSVAAALGGDTASNNGNAPSIAATVPGIGGCTGSASRAASVCASGSTGSGGSGNCDSDSGRVGGVVGVLGVVAGVAGVTGSTVGGVVGSVEFRDVGSNLRTPVRFEEIRDRTSSDETESSGTAYQEPYCETSLDTTLADAVTVPANLAVAERLDRCLDRTTTAVPACYDDDEEEDEEEVEEEEEEEEEEVEEEEEEEEDDEEEEEEEEEEEDDDDDDDDDEDEDEDEDDEEDNNMVAAMNEHLSTSSATSGAARTTTASTTSAVGAHNSALNQNNSCSRNEFQSVEEDGKPAAGILSFPCDFDHMYASMTDGGAPAAATATSTLGVSPLRGNEPRQNDHTEVKHLKELLLLHLDLIQQQSEQIVTKDKLLAALRQENETLKLRLERMDRRVNLQKLRSENSESAVSSEHIGTCSPPNVNSANVPSTSELHKSIQSENSNSQYNESFKIRLNTSGGITTVKQEPNDNQNKHDTKLETGNETTRLDWEEKKKRRSDPTPLSTGSKRKRGVSCSSTVSNDATLTIQEKASTHDVGRKSDRKGKPPAKKESFLTTEEHYYTAVGDSSYSLTLKEAGPMESSTSLEVPNWRVKIYTSCYTMEGTENLDDEIFNKRHLKLENDERRRKRWDVQRIREQRHIEKLKQRQERQNHQATCYNTNHTGPCPSVVEEETVVSLWPDIDQIQSLQVDPQLPVTAFGAPIPSFTPSEFSLPWTNSSRSNSRRPKRSTGRRKSTRR